MIIKHTYEILFLIGNAFNFQKYSIYNADNLGIPYNYWVNVI